MTPKTTIWELQPHTAAKHEILRRYLDAWAPILSGGGFPRLAIIDGFAGPGRYSKGEDGSPIIALKAVIEQRQPVTAKVDLHFIELEADRAAHLRLEIAAMSLPANISPEVHLGAFQDLFPKIWNHYAPNGKNARPPTFVFIDPFGFKIPFSSVAAVLRERSCEVFITFMFEEINRFLAQEKLPEVFDELFGCAEWRQGVALNQPSERIRFLHDLYQRQLQSAGARYVRSFAMRNQRNSMDYFLFFATSNEVGLLKMKHAMWRLDQSGTYNFSDATDPNQTVLFEAEPDQNILRNLIVAEFSGRRATVEQVRRFVITQTAFLDTHYKKVLRLLERAGTLTAQSAPDSRRQGTYADAKLVLEFAERQSTTQG